MKAITDKQPWASLIVEGIKDVENRTWKCPEKYIGKRILIHAGMAKRSSLQELLTIEQLNKVNESLDKSKDFDTLFPKGAIIGSVEIVDCVINHPSIWAEKSETNCSEKCRSKNCEHFIEWGFRGDNECRSCKLVGQSYEVEEVPKNCPHGVKINTIYNWVLANPIKFPKPILAKGKLGFWESECEIIICPKCGGYCLHDNHDVSIPNWGNPVHECVYCKNMILESEFEYLK